jgi:hypothetical protein
MASQSLAIKLQKPTFVVELSFLLGVTRFFVPTFDFANNSPLPYRTCDILLTGAHAAVRAVMHILALRPGLRDRPRAAMSGRLTQLTSVCSACSACRPRVQTRGGPLAVACCAVAGRRTRRA